jgi:hypothetical protein
MRKTVITLWLVAAPKLALACPACFGDANEPLTKAANSGIWFMLAIVAVMLAAFATFFIYLIRRGRLADRLEARQYAPGQEGTARC